MRNKSSLLLWSLIFVFSLMCHLGAIYYLSTLSIKSIGSFKKSSFLSHPFLDENSLLIEKNKERAIVEALEQLIVQQPENTFIDPESFFLPLDTPLDLAQNSSIVLIKDEPTSIPNLYLEEGISFSMPGIIQAQENSFFEEIIPLGKSGVSPTFMPAFFKEAAEGGTFVRPTSHSHSNLESHEFSMNNLGSIPSSNDFEISLEYVPKSLNPGYIFRITFLPKKEAVFKHIKQNFFFLIDRSNSISKVRYEISKHAVSRALNNLHPQDSFNIIIFDDKVVRLAPLSLPYSLENVKRANEFLSQQAHGGFHAMTDINTSLGKIIPQEVPDNEVNTAILISDGDTYLSSEKQRSMLGDFTRQNQGKISLFCLASGEGNNLSLLELLSLFNKGSLVYASTHELLETRLLQLIHSLRNPIGKSMIATAIASSNQISIELYPRAIRLPNLYEHRAFTIYGSINRLEDFTIFLQGKYYEKEFDIKKKVSFSNALMGNTTLDRQWTFFQAHDHIDRYFKDGSQAHLDKANQLLLPLHVQIPSFIMR